MIEDLPAEDIGDSLCFVLVGENAILPTVGVGNILDNHVCGNLFSVFVQYHYFLLPAGFKMIYPSILTRVKGGESVTD